MKPEDIEILTSIEYCDSGIHIHCKNKQEAEALKKEILEALDSSSVLSKCSNCGRVRTLAKIQIDIGTGGKTYYECLCHKVEELKEKVDILRYCETCKEHQNKHGFVTTESKCLSCILEAQVKEQLEKIEGMELGFSKLMRENWESKKIVDAVREWEKEVKEDYRTSKGSDYAEWDIKPILKKLKEILKEGKE